MNGEWGKNVIIFSEHNSLSAHTNNRKKDIVVLGKRPTDGLDDTRVTAEVKYSVNITNPRKKISLSLHYNAANSFLCTKNVKIHQFKANDLEIKPYPLCFGNISKDFKVDNMKKTGLNGLVNNFFC